jgi:hypothetical protein
VGYNSAHNAGIERSASYGEAEPFAGQQVKIVGHSGPEDQHDHRAQRHSDRLYPSRFGSSSVIVAADVITDDHKNSDQLG